VKKRGILNADLNAALSRLGHTDLIIVADCGMPAPLGVPVIDLALVRGIPGWNDVLDALLEDMIFERCVAASEIIDGTAYPWLTARFYDVEFISHEELKVLSSGAKLFIRTGEATPYANVALYCGVPF
jgi:D-ribose pyranase